MRGYGTTAHGAKQTLAKAVTSEKNLSATVIGLCGLKGSPRPSRGAERALVEVRGCTRWWRAQVLLFRAGRRPRQSRRTAKAISQVRDQQFSS